MSTRQRLALSLPLLLALVLWGVALRDIDPSRMTDIGLMAVLPLTFYLAIACVVAGFCASLWALDDAPPWAPGVYLAAWITIVHASPAIIYGTLRYAWAWKHLGIVEYIQRTGQIDPAIETLPVYHSWPGFFGTATLLIEAAGLPNALTIASWSPLFFELLFAGAVLFLLRAVSSDLRLIWLGAWFFALTNWVGQDYFAPQAMTFFFYLVVLAVCLWAFPGRGTLAAHPVGGWLLRRGRLQHAIGWLDQRIERSRQAAAWLPPLRWEQRVGLLLVVVALLVSINVSHQLTPVIMVLALAMLVICGQCSALSLPLIAGILTAVWLATGASTVANDGFREIIRTLGQANENIGENLIDASKFTPGFRLISTMARALTAAVGGLAALGWLVRLRRGYLDLPLTLLWVAPVGMLVLSSYGGEILFRVFFFALPFMAFYVGALVPGDAQGRFRWLQWLVTAGLSALLITGFLFAYYGHEDSNYFPPDEVAAAEYLDAVVPPGSLVVEVTPNYPSRYSRYEEYTYIPLIAWPRGNVEESENAYTLDQIVEMMADPRYTDAYLIVSHGQLATLSVPGLQSIVDIQREIEESSQFEVVYQSPNAEIYTLAARDPGAAS
jgi:hypothetical protein